MTLDFGRFFSTPKYLENFKEVERTVWIVGTQEERKVLAPETWSDSAVRIVANKYFRLVNGVMENSVRQMFTRIVNAITWSGIEQGYLDNDSAKSFSDELGYILINQMAAPNSPVFFNVGISDRPRSSACFINSVEDSMESILDLAKTEGMIFKHGGGSGLNVSTLRAAGERLSNGGTASGPISFMKGWDAFAGVIKSGGSTRRAAKMLILDISHPDISQFISCKAKEEGKARVLEQAGYSGGIEGEAATTVAYQNANHSVRVTDRFMDAVQTNAPWNLTSPATNEVLGTVGAQDLFREIAEAAWQCGDPGIQFHTETNRWNTCAKHGEIKGSNPCSEFVFLDDTACNLSSINLIKFIGSQADHNTFDVIGFQKVVDTMILAQEILVSHSSYPTQKITANSEKFRPLGLGYTNLGALLMTYGLPYDSQEGRGLAAQITALMHFRALRMSALLSRVVGPFEGYDAEQYMHVFGLHADAVERLDEGPIKNSVVANMVEAQIMGMKYGFRNAQLTLLAPTGTISFGMDCETTGIEPLMAPITIKTLIGGGTVTQTAGCADRWLKERERNPSPRIDAILQTSLGEGALSPEGHVSMMAAVQPFLSGSISKTVNMPSTCTVQDVMDIYKLAWLSDLKSIAIYRDGCKISQPVEAVGTKRSEPQQKESEPENKTAIESTDPDNDVQNTARRRLPSTRKSVTHKFEFGNVEGYLTVGLYEDGTVGELFIRVAKEGSTLSGLLDAVALSTSIGLQYGVPIDVFVEKFSHTRFEPSGWSSTKTIGFASSILDYIFRWIATEIPLLKATNQTTTLETTPEVSTLTEGNASNSAIYDSVLCSVCGSPMTRAGSCHSCRVCGTSSGCA